MSLTGLGGKPEKLMAFPYNDWERNSPEGKRKIKNKNRFCQCQSCIGWSYDLFLREALPQAPICTPVKRLLGAGLVLTVYLSVFPKFWINVDRDYFIFALLPKCIYQMWHRYSIKPFIVELKSWKQEYERFFYHLIR